MTNLQYRLDVATTNLRIQEVNKSIAEAEVALAHIAMGTQKEIRISNRFGNSDAASIIRFVSECREDVEQIHSDWYSRTRADGAPSSYDLVLLRFSTNWNTLCRLAMAAEAGRYKGALQ